MSTRHYAPARLLWVLALLLGSATLALAQTTIRGTITDAETEETLIGANVVIPGTSTGTATDFDGNFELTVPPNTSEIQVSYAGYETQTIPLTTGQTVYNVTMGAGQLLDEVVVVGYGTQTQSEVTSAVTSIGEKDFNQGVVSNPTQLVQGKVAGLQINTPTGDPNAAPTIRLRGLSTFGANSEPLVIIDGVIGASLSSVDPADIQSIDVLKDGSAAAIYGTRGSSGVILVTTKRGREGELRVNYRVQGEVTTLANSIPVADAARYAELRPSDVIDPTLDNDYYDELTRAALTQVHNLSLSGGLGTGNYRASVNYRDAEGVATFSGFDQLNGRLTVNQDAFGDMLSFNVTASATRRNEDVGISNAFQYATVYNPTVPIRGDSDGDVDLDGDGEPDYTVLGGFTRIDQFDFFNPIAINEQNSLTREIRDQLLSGRVAFRPVAGLELAAQYSSNITNRETSLYGNSFSNFALTGAQANGEGAGGLGIVDANENRNTLFETTATYELDLGGETNIDFLAGYSFQDLETDNLRIQTEGFSSDQIGLDNLALASGTPAGLAQIGSGGDRYEIESFFGRVQVDISDAYFLAASLRSDGSTRFGEGEKRNLFPAISAGVNLKEFVPSTAVNLLKLRAGYGVTGNLPFASRLALQTFSNSGDAPGYPLNGPGGIVPGIAFNGAANPGIRFERKGEFNAGLDFALDDYRLRGTFDFFNRLTEDLLFDLEVTTGSSTADGTVLTDNIVTANIEDANLRNRGVEFTLAYDVLREGQLTWTPRIVVSHVRTEIVASDNEDAFFQFFPGGGGGEDGTEAPARFDFSTSPGAPGQNGLPTQIIRLDEELGQFYTYVATGIDAGGNYIFEDLNGDGEITNDPRISPDKRVVGQALPDVTIGFQNEFTFGNFDASAFFRGAFGHSLANLPRNFYENVAGSQYNVVETGNFNPALAQSTFNSTIVERADFITLDNASIGYTIPIADDRIQNLRIGLAGRNLFYITRYSGVSPEVIDADRGTALNFIDPGRGNILAPGLDRRNNYFRTRSFNLSASVTF